MTDGKPFDQGALPSRIALFGGSFDPPHLGHIAIANAAAENFGLNAVIFTPTGLQPLKRNGAFASYRDRLGMVHLACATEPLFVVSELDAPRPDGQPNYTVNTLASLGTLYPSARLFAIAGLDSFLEMPKWHRSQDLLKLAEWIVVSRPGFSFSDGTEGHREGFAQTRIHPLTGVHNTISATDLRERLARGEDCSDSIPAPVIEYIGQHRLYRS